MAPKQTVCLEVIFNIDTWNNGEKGAGQQVGTPIVRSVVLYPQRTSPTTRTASSFSWVDATLTDYEMAPAGSDRSE